MSRAADAPVLIFEVGGQETNGGSGTFGLQVLNVLQVIEVVTVSPVPLAPGVVRGIINHNGRIVTVVDPAPILGLSAQTQAPTNVVILRRERRTKGNVGLQVLRIREIVAASTLEKVDVQAGPCVGWVARAKRRLIHIVELEPLLERLGHEFGSPERGDTRQGVNV
jgi:purine-binding chemotaxis protein CheW